MANSMLIHSLAQHDDLEALKELMDTAIQPLAYGRRGILPAQGFCR